VRELRVADWRRVGLDVAPTLGVVLLGVADIAEHPRSAHYPGWPPAHVAMLVLAATPFAFRRRFPVTTAVASLLLVAVWVAALYPVQNDGSFEAFLILLGTAFTIGSYVEGRRLLYATIGVFGGLLLFALVSVVIGDSVTDDLPIPVYWWAVWLIGRVLRQRQEQVARQRRRADQLAFERGRVEAEAAIEERSRIARELHDVIAHSLSVMVVQASAERRALRAGRSEAATTQGVLEAVEDTGRAALVELRGLLGLLRRAGGSPDLTPQPSLSQLDALLAQTRETGVAIELESDGVGDLPAGVDLSAYRIVQEALTNVVKHAVATRAVVRIARDPLGLLIEVTDDGRGRRGADSLPTGGHGLAGMRERTAMYGGSLDAGPMPDGGFRIRARLPVDAVVATP
jgi:signal transduction histidine kinase